VNSAASFVKKKFETTTLEEFENAISVNVKAPYFLSQHLLPSLSKHDDALIVNISDLSGVYPWNEFSAHGVSKAGLIHLTKVLAREIAPIRVNAIVPGPILPPPGMNKDNPAWKTMIQNIPLKRSGNPSDIGRTVVYLAESDFVTGSVIHVDGGESLVGPKNH
jgi:NAD(P)-dependent dehydrogenase (short-subunit alcohol dehydrogenase family)